MTVSKKPTRQPAISRADHVYTLLPDHVGFYPGAGAWPAHGEASLGLQNLGFRLLLR